MDLPWGNSYRVSGSTAQVGLHPAGVESDAEDAVLPVRQGLALAQHVQSSLWGDREGMVVGGEEGLPGHSRLGRAREAKV